MRMNEHMRNDVWLGIDFSLKTWNTRSLSTNCTIRTRKAQDAIDHAREVREKKMAERAKSDGLPPLITDSELQRCSVCGPPFSPYLSTRLAESG